MNKKGFTLTELLIVVVLLSIIMTITIPSLMAYKKVSDQNLHSEYEKMMVLYAEEKNIQQDKIRLVELDGLETIKNNCKGYVKKENNKYRAYISCNDNYETKGYEKGE